MKMYEISDEEYQRIECEMSALCLKGMSLAEDSPDHQEIQREIKEWHEKYDHLFEKSNK